MNLAELSLVLFAISVLAGALGSLLGLGGGFVVVPALTLIFHLDIRLAVGASIVAVAATSSAAAARNVTQSITNLRVATFLALATTVGAVTGALSVRPGRRPFPVRVVRGDPRPLGAADAPQAARSPAGAGAGRRRTRGRGARGVRWPRCRAAGVGALASGSAAGGAKWRGGSPSTRPTSTRPKASRSLTSSGAHGARPRAHVRGGDGERSARDRLGSVEGAGDGPGHAHPDEGLDGHEQPVDRADGSGERRGLFRPR